MATVFDVAKYIVKKYGSMTTMKLQKLCYYCQAWALAWDEEPLFNEEFQAWANGPVCPELFALHKGKFVADINLFDNDEIYPFTDKEKETINSVLDYYGDKEPQWLSQLTHMESPWVEARKGYTDGMACSVVITKDSMQQYYGGLQ